MTGSYLTKLYDLISEIRNRIKYGDDYEAIKCDFKYHKLLMPYIEKNYSELLERTLQLFESGPPGPNIERDFKGFPIYDDLKTWKIELTDALLKNPKWERQVVGRVSDVHVAFCCGIFSALEKRKKDNLEAKLSQTAPSL